MKMDLSADMEDIEDDTHICLKCRTTIRGLDNYVKHRRSGCTKSSSCESSFKGTDRLRLSSDSHDLNLKADDFFSLLELQSSKVSVGFATVAKTSGMITRSKAHGNERRNAHNKRARSKKMATKYVEQKNSSKESTRNSTPTVVAESKRTSTDDMGHCDDVQEYDVGDALEQLDDNPPRLHTGGKWKPGGNVRELTDDSSVSWSVPLMELDQESCDFSPEVEAPEEPLFSQTGGKWKPSGGKIWRSLQPQSPLLSSPRSSVSPPPKSSPPYNRPPSASRSLSPHSPSSKQGKSGGGKIWRSTHRTSIGGFRSPSRADSTPSPTSGSSKLWNEPPPTYTGGKWKPSVTRPPSPQSPVFEGDKCWKNDESETPPESYTGGKWKPRGQIMKPSENYTGGKWKPRYTNTFLENDTNDEVPYEYPISEHYSVNCEDKSDLEEPPPPPEHTRGKWAPGMASKFRAAMGLTASTGTMRKSLGSVQYWCGTCNRRLSSRTMYERHLQSDLHFKRALPEHQLEVIPVDQKRAVDSRRHIRRPGILRDDVWDCSSKRSRKLQKADRAGYDNNQLSDFGAKRRIDRRGRPSESYSCPVCRVKVYRQHIGKHLVSSLYHWRSSLKDKVRGELKGASRKFVLDNIHTVIYQAPFQCSMCKFYCNSAEDFRQHWDSKWHLERDQQTRGEYWCSSCDEGCITSLSMKKHLQSYAHCEWEAAVNKTVAVVVSRREGIPCLVPGCGAVFRFNLQLAAHERQLGHRSTQSTACDSYQSRFWCQLCGHLCRTRLSLQKHTIKYHAAATASGGSEGAYYCGACSMKFHSASEAVAHRDTREHREKARDARECRTRSCPHCDQLCSGVGELRKHLEVTHPDEKYKCMLCGEHFTLPQQVSRHAREAHASTTVSKLETTDFPRPDLLIPPPESRPPFQCVLSSCVFSTVSRAEFLFHQVLHSTDKGEIDSDGIPKYQCPLCDKIFRKPSLRAHLRVHTGEKPFVCKICDKEFSRKDSLVTHQKTLHRSFPSLSEHYEEEDETQCSKRIADLENAMPDIVLEEAEEVAGGLLTDTVDETMANIQTFKYHCENCTFTTVHKGSIRRHQLTHSLREKTVLCAICADRFFDNAALQQHMSVHALKPLACPTSGCVYRARSAAELREHQASHSDERSFPCGACDFSAKTRRQLNRHSKIHGGAYLHHCQHCTFTSHHSAHIKRHMRVHTGAKPYKCPHCIFRCNTLENLRKHVFSTSKHPGKMLYECSFCSNLSGSERKVFSTNLAREYRTHLVAVHGKMFQTSKEAASYVAGIYDKSADPVDVDNPIPAKKIRKSAFRKNISGESRQLQDFQQRVTPDSVFTDNASSDASEAVPDVQIETPTEMINRTLTPIIDVVDYPSSISSENQLLGGGSVGEMLSMLSTDNAEEIVFVEMDNPEELLQSTTSYVVLHQN